MTNETFIREHREDDVRQLALRCPPEGIDLRWCLQQIEGWQLACRKLPGWAATEGVWYPPRLSLEQCSSEETARYKRQTAERLIPPSERHAMADLTGGLGVDFSQMATLFREATYVEILPHLVELAQHNMPLLVEKTVKLHCSLLTSHFLDEPSGRGGYSLLFLDPARRDTAGRKTVSISDCTPNLLDMQDELLQQSHWLMVKLSPMLDITEALRQLHGVHEVHVISLRGECKELLFVMRTQETGDKEQVPTVYGVNLGTDDDLVSAPLSTLSTRERAIHTGLLGEHLYLYEPNASVLKAGLQDVLPERYPVSKLHPQSHLFVSDHHIPHFPGRRFRITGWSDFSKRGIKGLLGDLRQANLTVRNFPTNVASLRRQLRLGEGGDTYLFATTVADGQRVLIRTRRVLPSE